jgi:hypothetical protein
MDGLVDDDMAYSRWWWVKMWNNACMLREIELWPLVGCSYIVVYDDVIAQLVMFAVMELVCHAP